MKHIFLFFAIVIMSVFTMAQVPQKMKIQILRRNYIGELDTNKTISYYIYVKNSLKMDVYQEPTQIVTTDANGVATLELGSKKSFADIDWSADNYYLYMSDDSHYSYHCYIPLMSVPYALYAEKAESTDVDLSIYATKEDTYSKSEIDALVASFGGTSGNGVNNGMEYVDLGLSVKWATCNIGASKPEEYGNRYAWGETTPTTVGYTDISYTNISPYFPFGGNWTEYKYCNGTEDTMTKYCKDDNKTELEKDDDVAYTTLGDKWRMPTSKEWDELGTLCHLTMTQRDGVSGLLVEAPNGNSIFLPKLVEWPDLFPGNKYRVGYWSSSFLDRLGASTAQCAYLDDLGFGVSYNSAMRCMGLMVRPVFVGDSEGQGNSQNNSDTTGSVQIEIENGAIKAPFSVSSTKQVYFSQGNLQYKASTNTWRFAEHQYDWIGVDNQNISSSYNGWIDLFGWGTSGYNGKNPYMTERELYYISDSSNYGVVGDAYADIAGTNYDWGVYNAISNGGNCAGMWRTLTCSEWNYLLYERPDANSLKIFAKINGVMGLILLPDNWTTPEGITFKCHIGGVIVEYENRDINKYTTSEWAKMEANGAVFLPAANFRSGSKVCYFDSDYSVDYRGRNDSNVYGTYWSASMFNNLFAYSLYIAHRYWYLVIMDRNYRCEGHSVRLVQDVK